MSLKHPERLHLHHHYVHLYLCYQQVHQLQQQPATSWMVEARRPRQHPLTNMVRLYASLYYKPLQLSPTLPIYVSTINKNGCDPQSASRPTTLLPDAQQQCTVIDRIEKDHPLTPCHCRHTIYRSWRYIHLTMHCTCIILLVLWMCYHISSNICYFNKCFCPSQTICHGNTLVNACGWLVLERIHQPMHCQHQLISSDLNKRST